MDDYLFARAYPLARRAAKVRSAAAVAVASIAAADREDIEQQAMVGVWLALPRFDSSRASLRTFVERVVYTKIVSAVRSDRALRRKPRAEAPHLLAASNPVAAFESHVDVATVLIKLRVADRRLARLLVDHTPSEVCRVLGISRSTAYEGIRRIRTAFIAAGLTPWA